jgi:hypothetical protein
MRDYERWNEALISYEVDSTPAGAPVFLSTDEDTIARVGRQAFPELAALPAEEILADFRRAVRARVVKGTRVTLDGLREVDAYGRPRCAGFLAALVLAASRMRDSGDLDDVNYFGRLREVLELPPGSGRPEGIRSGGESEEPLWRLWNFWLQTQGRLPSAVPGPEGPLRFVNYARTQALLRGVDQDRLISLFRDRGWQGDLDAQTLFTRVRREAPYLTIQLRDLLLADSRRREAVAEAIHALYEQWRIDPSGRTVRSGIRGRNLYAGLYRVTDPLGDEVTYYLYPPTPRRALASELWVELPDGIRALRPDRPGWYRPLMPIDGGLLINGARYPIQQPADIEALVLVQRRFWLLVPDPDNPESTVRATWGQPGLGVPFTVLCRPDVLAELRLLEQEKMLAWRGEPVPVLDGHWLELRDCAAVSEAWSGAQLTSSDLYDALRPADRCNIGLSGGLRFPGGGGWLEGSGPRVTVFGFGAEAEVTITNVTRPETEHVVVEWTQQAGGPVHVHWPGPGTYRVSAHCSGQEAQPRLVGFLSWDEVRLAPEVTREPLELNGIRLLGAAIE